VKKFICLVLCLFLSVCCLSACSGYETNTPDATSDKINIVTTVFPIYDWIRNITGDISNVNINMLLDKGVDLHSFQPTADDIYNTMSEAGSAAFAVVGPVVVRSAFV